MLDFGKYPENYIFEKKQQKPENGKTKSKIIFLLFSSTSKPSSLSAKGGQTKTAKIFSPYTIKNSTTSSARSNRSVLLFNSKAFSLPTLTPRLILFATYLS